MAASGSSPSYQGTDSGLGIGVDLLILLPAPPCPGSLLSCFHYGHNPNKEDTHGYMILEFERWIWAPFHGKVPIERSYPMDVK